MSSLLIKGLDTPTIAIMVNWNGKAYLQASLSSVLSELAFHNGKLLLVDNDSSDGSAEFVRQNFPEVFIFETGENLGGAGGFSTGMNLALQCDQCEYIWLLDNDIVVEKNALRPLIDCLLANTKAGAAGSQICLYDKPETIQEIGAHISPWLGGLKQCFSGQIRLTVETKPWTVDYIAACSVLIKRECLEQVGVFGNFFLFYDDVEWGLRTKRLGWSLWGVPASVIRHQFSATKPTLAWREYYRKRNRLTVLLMYPPQKGSYGASLIYLWFLSYLVLANKWRGYFSLYSAYLWARQDALQGKLGKRDLAILNDIESNKPIFQFPENVNEVLVDIGESAGDALFLMQKIRQANPSIDFYLPKYLSHYFKLTDIDNVFASEKNNYPMVITGREYKFSSLTKSNYCFNFKDGSLVPQSYWKWFKDRMIKISAILLSAIVMPYFTFLWFMRFKVKQLKDLQA